MISIKKVTAALGAEVSGINLSEPLDDATVKAIRQALDDNQVLFFRGQKKLTVDEHVRLGSYFGEIDLPLFRTASSTRPEILVLDQTAPKGQGADNFHSDNTFRAAPTMGSILQAHQLPSVGGDTCFASMHAAFEALSPPMQKFLEGLTAVHSLAKMTERTSRAGTTFREDSDKWPPRSHPVVAIHPRTQRKLLYVNKNWTSHIEDVSQAESDALMSFLLNHVKSPEFQVRMNWNEGDVTFWDNLATNHYAVADYRERRMMQRVAIKGEKIFGTMPSKNDIAAPELRAVETPMAG
jgi:taurine dioxygenase